jgi:C_GCAxxG_C_C family probable redox protein
VVGVDNSSIGKDTFPVAPCGAVGDDQTKGVEAVRASKAGIAEENVIKGFSCSQSLFSTYCEDLGMDRITGLRVAGIMGGGVCGHGEICGAITAVAMLIGLKYGRTNPEDAAAKEFSYGLGKEFVRRFRKEFEAIKCKELLGYDLSTDIGVKCLDKNQLIKQLCPGIVKRAAEIYEELMAEQK